VVAVTIKQLGEALANLDAESRALLDLNVRRGLEESEIADILSVKADEVSTRREKILSGLDDELGLHTREARDELRATLPDVPADCWQER
jgi:DNA-directed RNA polymerase specialized sigma24 family protein